MFGADPEFFFMKKKRVIGCEKLISQDGEEGGEGKIIIDGVQAEMNIDPSTCRQLVGSRIKRLFDVAHDLIKDHKELSISVDPLVPITKRELGNLSDKAKFFGCTPSKNIYDERNVMPITDSSKYYFRSAGGHIHIGGGESRQRLLHENQKEYIKMMDIIVGNTCVLLDRDNGNIERRRVYGRAGEYRVPRHGLEYRTLSNFWLRDYVLVSFVLGLTRIAFSLVTSKLEDKTRFADKIFKAVDQELIRKAINDNDFDLAMQNFLQIKDILEEIIPNEEYEMTLCKNNMQHFLTFVNNGIDHYFSKDVIKNWKDFSVDYFYENDGWENFLMAKV